MYLSTHLVAIFVLGGCAFGPPLVPEDHSDEPIISTPSDPLPQPEPRSRYGNPDSYEEFGRRYHVMDDASGFAERGIASWYGPKFHGRRTSSGEPYDMHAMTAAHKTLPLPTWVQVTNLKNRRSVLVKVNDRGPFIENRVIDLSHEAAKRLDMIRDGTGMVDVRVIEYDSAGNASVVTTPINPPETVVVRETVTPQAAELLPMAPAPTIDTTTAEFEQTPREVLPAALPVQTINLYAQIGAFGNIDNAERLFIRVRNAGIGRVDIVDSAEQSPRLFRVRVGPVHDPGHYDLMVAELNALGIDQVTLIMETAAYGTGGVIEN